VTVFTEKAIQTKQEVKLTQFTGRVLPTTAQPEPVRFRVLLTIVEIWSDALQILSPLVPSSQQDAMHTEPTSDPDFIDLTLSD
jgi:hypothetical protein